MSAHVSVAVVTSPAGNVEHGTIPPATAGPCGKVVVVVVVVVAGGGFLAGVSAGVAAVVGVVVVGVVAIVLAGAVVLEVVVAGAGASLADAGIMPKDTLPNRRQAAPTTTGHCCRLGRRRIR